METFKKRLDKLQSVSPEDTFRYAAILEIVKHVENKKQIHLSNDERIALAISLLNEPETLDQITDRAEILIRSTDYSRIPFDVWLNTKRMYTEEELNLKVYQTIENHKKRIQEAKTANINEHILNEELLISEQHIYGQRIDNIKERARVKLRERLKKAERFIKTAPDEVQEQLLKILAERNLLTNEDPHWKTIIRLFVPHILIETEKIMKENNVK